MLSILDIKGEFVKQFPGEIFLALGFAPPLLRKRYLLCLTAQVKITT